MSTTKIQVLGPGCAKCEKLARNAREAADDLGLDCEIEKVTDMQEIVGFGVMMTPALVVDGKVVLMGKAASAAHVKKLLTS